VAVQTLVRRRVTDSASGVNLDELAEAHAEFDRRHAAPLHTSWKPHENTRALDRPLRLGFLSPDLGKHPIGYFLIRVLENLERREGEIICYSDRITRDELTSRFQTAATTWSNVAGRSDERLVQQIRVDRIDTLFDLAGHTAQNRFFLRGSRHQSRSPGSAISGRLA
jgi:predicted O-linked N-acetylglucosamine transferase (SPINDLY family)